MDEVEEGEDNVIHYIDVVCYTEYKDDKGLIFRCHPNYRGDCSCYDWIKVHWVAEIPGVTHN